MWKSTKSEKNLDNYLEKKILETQEKNLGNQEKNLVN